MADDIELEECSPSFMAAAREEEAAVVVVRMRLPVVWTWPALLWREEPDMVDRVDAEEWVCSVLAVVSSRLSRSCGAAAAAAAVMDVLAAVVAATVEAVVDDDNVAVAAVDDGTLSAPSGLRPPSEGRRTRRCVGCSDDTSLALAAAELAG